MSYTVSSIATEREELWQEISGHVVVIIPGYGSQKHAATAASAAVAPPPPPPSASAAAAAGQSDG